MVAIKKLDEVFQYVKDAKRILREIILLRELNNHRNVVKLYDIIVPEDPKTFNTLYLVFEHAASDVRKVYRSKYFLTEKHIQTIMFNLLCGIHYLHSAEVIHRDIKPGNILVTQDCTAKICDFGLARQLKGITSTDDVIQ